MELMVTNLNHQTISVIFQCADFYRMNKLAAIRLEVNMLSWYRVVELFLKINIRNMFIVQIKITTTKKTVKFRCTCALVQEPFGDGS